MDSITARPQEWCHGQPITAVQHDARRVPYSCLWRPLSPAHLTPTLDSGRLRNLRNVGYVIIGERRHGEPVSPRLNSDRRVLRRQGTGADRARAGHAKRPERGPGLPPPLRENVPGADRGAAASHPGRAGRLSRSTDHPQARPSSPTALPPPCMGDLWPSRIGRCTRSRISSAGDRSSPSSAPAPTPCPALSWDWRNGRRTWTPLSLGSWRFPWPGREGQ